MVSTMMMRAVIPRASCVSTHSLLNPHPHRSISHVGLGLQLTPHTHQQITTSSSFSARSLRSQIPHRTLSLPHRRALSTTTPPPPSPTANSQHHQHHHEDGHILATYKGPLYNTFRRLKLFSLSSLVFAAALTPYLLLGPAALETFGRIALVVTALSASSASTALISWIGKPYVGTLHLVRVDGKHARTHDPLPPSDTRLVAHTTSWRLQPLKTTIYQPSYIRGTSRPFAQWQLAAAPSPLLISDPSEYSTSNKSKLRSLIAETRKTSSGDLVGQYWVEWRPDALSRVPTAVNTAAEEPSVTQQEPTADALGGWRMEGVCKIEGKPVRHFNVHEELLDDDWRVLE
ncbi:unnamed protein product [Tilletia controversa]|nr:unnamed protein product [Tilletia controversa]